MIDVELIKPDISKVCMYPGVLSCVHSTLASSNLEFFGVLLGTVNKDSSTRNVTLITIKNVRLIFDKKLLNKTNMLGICESINNETKDNVLGLFTTYYNKDPTISLNDQDLFLHFHTLVKSGHLSTPRELKHNLLFGCFSMIVGSLNELQALSFFNKLFVIQTSHKEKILVSVEFEILNLENTKIFQSNSVSAIAQSQLDTNNHDKNNEHIHEISKQLTEELEAKLEDQLRVFKISSDSEDLRSINDKLIKAKAKTKQLLTDLLSYQN